MKYTMTRVAAFHTRFCQLIEHRNSTLLQKITLAAILLNCCTANAQYHLSGTSYTQNFDELVLGLPMGWEADTNAKAGSLGGAALYTASPSSTTRWNTASGGFKNVASANGFPGYSSATAALQLAATDRALGVRQTGSFGDPGAAFTFQIDNTYGLSDFELDLKVQSLDSGSGRSTEWLIQYASGDHPAAFTTLAAYSTGGYRYENTPFRIGFGTALDDQREKVWIRIVALAASTGSGSRTTSAIDDFVLRWKGIATPGFRPLARQLFPVNGSVAVRPGSILAVKFSRYITLGISGAVRIKNESDHTTQTIHAGSSFLSVNDKELLITGVRLYPGKTYHVTFDSSIADTAAATTYALEDTSEWRFTTGAAIPVAAPEFFDTACSKGNALPASWTKFSVAGNESWNCREHSSGNHVMRMYGNDGTINSDNEDWLISPLLDLSSPDAVAIAFSLYKQNSGTELSVLVSNDYAGSGPPDSASWINIRPPMSVADVDRWIRYTLPAGTWKNDPVYAGFQYRSDRGSAYDILIDSFMVMTKTGIGAGKRQEGRIRVIGQGSGQMELLFSGVTYGAYSLELFNALGQQLIAEKIRVTVQEQRFSLGDGNLLPGFYVLHLYHDGQHVVQKLTVW